MNRALRPERQPLLRSENLPPSVPIQPAPRPERLAVVTCFWNPAGYRRLVTNYHRFRDGLRAQGADLWTIELHYGTPALPDATTTCAADPATQTLWHKEQLLNLQIGALPPEYDAVAWIDADLLFPDGWIEAALGALVLHPVVQLFERIEDLGPKERVFRIREGCAKALHRKGKAVGLPGGAWAARRGAIAAGLYTANVIGGGDEAMRFAWTRDPRPSSLRAYSPGRRKHFMDWADRQTVNGSIGYLPITLRHLFHGFPQDRLYRARRAYLTDDAFDPATDLEHDANGAYRWTAHALAAKPRMVERVRNYFTERRDDDDPWNRSR